VLGREPSREAKAFGLRGEWVAGDPAVSERRALPARSPDRHLKFDAHGRLPDRGQLCDKAKLNARARQSFSDGRLRVRFGARPPIPIS
jgi:hypothetical protein